MKVDYTKQTVLVTGGTRGIGRQISYDMIASGANVIVTGASMDSLSKLDGRFTKFRVDFLDDDSVSDFINFISNIKIDACINNAGINAISPLEEISDDNWHDILKVNLTAPYKILKAVTKSMKNHKYGRVINISSIWGTIGKEHRVSYSASKFGLRGLTLSSGAELAEHNILVNTVSPGFTLTDLTRKVLGEVEMEKIAKTIPIRRMALPKEISNVVLFMASNLNTYISGQNIVVDGGFVNV